MKRGVGLVCTAALLVCGQSWAQTTWTFSGTSGAQASSSYSVLSGGVTLTPSAWANTAGTGASSGDTTKLENQYGTSPNTGIYFYSGGLGVHNKDGCGSTGGASGCDVNEPSTTGEHAIDNDGRYEMVLLSFSQLVNLTGFKIGWSTGDSDMTLLAYTGAGSPIANLSNLSWGQLATNGWQLISHYGGVPVNPATPTPTSAASSLFSSYWLLGAYNPLVGAATCRIGGSCGTGSPDYVKLSSVTGVTREETPGVPEPGSLALLGLALFGMISVSRRRTA